MEPSPKNVERVLVVKWQGSTSTLVDEVERLMLDNGIDSIEVEIQGVHSVDEVIRSGFMPGYIHLDRFRSEISMLIDHYVGGFSVADIKFWHFNKDINSLVSQSTSNTQYIYANIQGWKDLAIRTSISFPLLMYARDQTYKSNRPRTDMLMFRQTTSGLYDSIRVESSEHYDYRLTFGGREFKGLPVTRYAAGMSKGLYFTGDSGPTNYCGTFFYYEPESTTYLTFTACGIYRNKYEAAVSLLKNVEPPKVFARDWYTNPDTLPLDLMLSPLDYIKRMRPDLGDDIHGIYPGISDRKHYVGNHLGLYAAEDKFDQLLCKAAKQNQLDILMFTHMIGSHQVVTEILDVRERKLCFDNLTFPKY